MKTKTAYIVRAEINGQSWQTRATATTAENEAEAIERAKKILRLTPEHTTTVRKVTVHELDKTLTSENYPYGRLRTTAHFSVEYSKTKGYRTTFQTVNPKNGRLNAIKKSTYSLGLILPVVEENGHISYIYSGSINGTEEINKALYFCADFSDILTEETKKAEAATILSMMIVNMKAQVIYAGANIEELKPLYTQQIENIKQIMKGAHYNFENSLLNFDKIEAVKNPNYNPFQVKAL